VYALSDIAVSKSDGVSTYEPGELLVYTVIGAQPRPGCGGEHPRARHIPAGLIDVTCGAAMPPAAWPAR
jgi:hypothetical protein